MQLIIFFCVHIQITYFCSRKNDLIPQFKFTLPKALNEPESHNISNKLTQFFSNN